MCVYEGLTLCAITQTAISLIILFLKIFLKTAVLNTRNLQIRRDHSVVFYRSLMNTTVIFRPAQACVFIQEQLHVSVLTGDHNNFSLHTKTGTTLFNNQDFVKVIILNVKLM